MAAIDWALAIGSTERVATALDISEYFDPEDYQDEIQLHAAFDASFELFPTGANNAAPLYTSHNRNYIFDFLQISNADDT